jgi:hypothetical protein
MKKARKPSSKTRVVSADEIARRADRGEDVSRFFTNTGRMMPPIQRVNVDFKLLEVGRDRPALNINRQAVIKTLREGLDRRYLAESARNHLDCRRGPSEPTLDVADSAAFTLGVRP